MRWLIIPCCVAMLAAADPATPASTVREALSALRSNQLAPWWVAHAPTPAPAPPAEPPADGQAPPQGPPPGGPNGGDRLRGFLRPLAGLAQADEANQAIAATMITELLGQLGPALQGVPMAPPPRPDAGAPAAGGGRTPPMAAMIARELIAGMVSQVLAEGLETRQVAALKAWGTQLSAWSTTLLLDDPATQQAVLPHLLATAKVLADGGLPRGDTGALLTRIDLALPPLKAAFAAAGADLDALLDRATITEEPGDGERRFVTLRFSADSEPLVLALRRNGERWLLMADSPLLAWMRGAGRGGRQGNGRPQRGGPPQPEPGQAPGPQPQGF